MILSFRDEWLRAFFVDDIRSRNIPPDLEDRLFRRLQMIDDAMTDQDLRSAQQSFREAERQAGGVSFDPSQQAMTVGISVGWESR